MTRFMTSLMFTTSPMTSLGRKRGDFDAAIRILAGVLGGGSGQGFWTGVEDLLAGEHLETPHWLSSRCKLIAGDTSFGHRRCPLHSRRTH